MVTKLAFLIAVTLVIGVCARWAFLPARYLPGNRVRSLRMRLHLRLYPGKGFASIFSLWLRWGRVAALSERLINRGLACGGCGGRCVAELKCQTRAP